MSSLVNYLKFICKQLSHLQPWSYWLWFMGVGFQLCLLVTQPITTISVLSFLGATLGLLCVISIAACKAINGWLGILSGICFMVVAFSAKNYLTIFEQLGYIVTLDIPVIKSLDWNKGVASKVRHLDFLQWIVTLGFTLIVWLVSSYAVNVFTNDPRPLVDGLVFAVSLVGGILTWARFSENFVFWSFVGIFQIILWGLTAMQHDASIAMLVSSLFYFANDVIGFTLSPWFNKKVRAQAIKDDKVIYND